MEPSVLASKCTLVPSSFYEPDGAREALSKVCTLSGADEVRSLYVESFDAYLIYVSGGESSLKPEMYFILEALGRCTEYNRIVCSWAEGTLYMGVAQGGRLLLANVYEAPDFTTAEYYIFLAMNSLQLNPEVSKICWRLPITEEQQMSLYRYFKAVENL